MPARHPPAGETMSPGPPREPAISNILLVDDRPENLMALVETLAPLGHRLVTATSGKDALRHVLQDRFAVILLDVEMPETDGLETARLIKQRTRSEHVPIIFMTALTQDRRQVTLGYESGAVDYLFKPFDPDLLRAKVSAFVELDQLRDALAKEQGRRFSDLALRESEERFRLVQKATNDVIWDWDLETGRLRWSDLASSILGMAGKQVPEDASWWFDHIHPDDRERVEAGVHAVIDGKDNDAWSDEYRFELGDGSLRTFLDRGYVARTEEGRAVRMIGAKQDVTERVQAREAAARAQEDAERARAAAEAASRLKSEFLATMSHEFRTPLNAIIGYAQLLDMGILGPTTPAQHAHLERLQSSAHHLLRIVDDVLDVAKVDADRLDVRRDLMLTGAAVAAAVTLVHPQATASGVRLIDLRAEEPGVLYIGDEHRVRQVLVNLVSNAVKFTPPGGQVTIECGAADEPEPGVWRAPARSGHPAESYSRWAFIRVSDTGPGITPEFLSHMFEPFTQGDSALTREKGGTGLGLAISRRLARLMGGDITVHSERGTGAVFTLWLPSGNGEGQTAAVQRRSDTFARFTPALGTAAIVETETAPLDAAAYDVLHALGTRLADDAETVAVRYIDALRANRHFPNVLELPAAQLRDHVTPFIGLLASQLMVIGETRGEAPELLEDGGQLQRYMAELHGAQRHRIGWTEVDIEREMPLLFAEVERSLRAFVQVPPGGIPEGTQPPFSPDAARTATDYAVNIGRHIIERATRTALRSHRLAKASAAQ